MHIIRVRAIGVRLRKDMQTVRVQIRGVRAAQAVDVSIQRPTHARLLIDDLE